MELSRRQNAKSFIGSDPMEARRPNKARQRRGMCIHVSTIVEEGSESESMEAVVTRQRFHTESRMWENCTLRPYYATASQAGSMRVNRRKTAKSVLWVAEGRACVPDNKGRSALLYTPWKNRERVSNEYRRS